MRDQDFNLAESSSGFSFTTRDFLAIGFRHKRLMRNTFIAMALAAAVATALMPPKYDAVAKVLVKRERVDPIMSSEKASPLQIHGEVTEEELNSEIELINSADVLRQTVVTCGLDKRKSTMAMLGFPPSGEERIAKAMLRLKGDLKVELLKKSDIISLTYTSSNPKVAAQVLTTLANAYIEKHVAVHRPEGQLKFFEQEAARYKQNLDRDEAQLKLFADGQGGVAPQMARDMSLQKLSEFNGTLQATRAEMASTEKRMQDLRRQMGSTPDRLTTQMKESDNSQVLQQLKSALLTLELKRTELLTKYQPTYRLVQEVDKQIADTRSSITSEETKPLKEETTDQNPTYSWIRTELAKAESDYTGLQARAQATELIVRGYQDSSRNLEVKGYTQQDLLRAQKADEENYLLYLHKQEEARVADALDQRRIFNVALAETPVVPSLPTNSQFLFGMVGLLVAGMVSLGAAFAAEYLDPSFRTPTEVVSELRIPVLASVPQRQRASEAANGNGMPVMVESDVMAGADSQRQP